MLLVQNAICILLITCFDEELVQKSNCPNNCKCYSAPKDGYDWSKSSISLICDDINDISLSNLKPLEPINTFAVGLKDIQQNLVTDPTHPLTKLYLNNLYLYGNEEGVDTPINQSISSLMNSLDTNTLEVLTLIDLNISDHYWTYVVQLKELKAIYIKSSVLKRLSFNEFGLLSELKITSLSIIESQVDVIDEKTFKNWNQLKLLSIVGNPLSDLNWVTSDFPNLWFLNLKNNYITTIPEGFFDHFPKLRVLNLDDNNLKILNWNLIKPGLSLLKEFSFQSKDSRSNILCASSEVENMFNEWKKLDSNQTVPAFFNQSMQKLMCKDVSGYHPPHNYGAPIFLCQNMSGEKDLDLGFIFCLNWPGGKKVDHLS